MDTFFLVEINGAGSGTPFPEKEKGCHSSINYASG
jgi:hypothetical protein